MTDDKVTCPLHSTVRRLELSDFNIRCENEDTYGRLFCFGVSISTIRNNVVNKPVISHYMQPRNGPGVYVLYLPSQNK